MSNKLQRVLCELDSMERTASMFSPLHRIDARSKLLTTVVFLVTMLSVPLTNLSELLLYFIYPIILSSMGGMSYVTVAKRSLIVLPFVAFVGVFNIFYDSEPVFYIGSVAMTAGWISFISIILRGLLSVQALIILINSTGYYRLCRSMQRMGIPSIFATQLLFVYRYIYVLIEEMMSMQRARDARSFGRKSYPLRIWGTLVGQLLVRTFDRAEQIGRAMQARGFTGRMPAAIGEQSTWRLCDTVFFAAWTAALIVIRISNPVERLSTIFPN